MVKRFLTDAVMAGSTELVRSHLEKLKERELLHCLDHPVDESLDTLLHRAVQLRHEDITNELIMAGASCDARNIRGDRPDECFMWPRCDAAARAVWQQRNQPDDGYTKLFKQ